MDMNRVMVAGQRGHLGTPAAFPWGCSRERRGRVPAPAATCLGSDPVIGKGQRVARGSGAKLTERYHSLGSDSLAPVGVRRVDRARGVSRAGEAGGCRRGLTGRPAGLCWLQSGSDRATATSC